MEKRGSRSSIVSDGCYTCYHSGMQHANSQAKIFSDRTIDFKILCILKRLGENDIEGVSKQLKQVILQL